jgi:hypothetical protein
MPYLYNESIESVIHGRQWCSILLKAERFDRATTMLSLSLLVVPDEGDDL